LIILAVQTLGWGGGVLGLWGALVRGKEKRSNKGRPHPFNQELSTFVRREGSPRKESRNDFLQKGTIKGCGAVNTSHTSGQTGRQSR